LRKSIRIEAEIRQKTGVKAPARVKRLIHTFIDKLDLNLSNLVVLTEAASGNYIFTPLIAAMADAEMVFAFTKDSKYGKAGDIMGKTMQFAEYLGVDGIVKTIDVLEPSIIKKADVVTNLGFLRPIDKDFISNLKSTAVITLMFETWEFREHDLDLRECWVKGIPVLGTNEKHPTIRIFEYIGHLCMKKLYSMGVEVFGSKIVLIGTLMFGRNIIKVLSTSKAEVLCVTEEPKREIEELGGVKIGSSFKEQKVQNKIRNCDAIITNTYGSPDVLFGKNSSISAKKLRELAPGACVIQLTGRIDRKSLHEYGLLYTPETDPGANHMGWTLADLGAKPVIALHSGGLKVGELLTRARLKGFNSRQAELEALKNDICMDFSKVQREKYDET
jgi:hypothetical protein